MKPMPREGIELGTFQYANSSDIHYYVTNTVGEEFEISEDIANELETADGTRELMLSPDIIKDLKAYGIIHTSRFVRTDNGYNRFILFPVSLYAKKSKNICKLLNWLLPFASIGLIVASIAIWVNGNHRVGHDFNHYVLYSMMLVTIIVHEIGHLIAGLANGQEFKEIGVLLLKFIPIGVYVGLSEKTDNTVQVNAKIQICLAGIEMNILFIAVLLIAAYFYYPLSWTLLAIVFCNTVFIVANLLPARGTDGEATLSTVLRVSSINAIARKYFFNKKKRDYFLSKGPEGYACLGVFIVTIMSDVLEWVIVGSLIIVPIIY